MKILKITECKEHTEEMVSIIRDAFFQKFSLILGKGEEYRKALNEIIVLDNTYVYMEDEKVLGVMILLKKGKPAFSIKFKPLKKIYGIFKALKVLIFLKLIFDFDKPGEDTLKIEMLAVGKRARGKGVGHKLLIKAEEIAKDEKKIKMKLEVIDTNPRARSLYERFNYKEIKYIDTHRMSKDAGFNGIYLMEKIL